MRIFIGFRNTIGYGGNLTRGFHKLGIPCDFYCLDANTFKYDVPENKSWLFRKMQEHSASRGFSFYIYSALFAVKSALTHDGFIFISDFQGSKYYLPLLKLLGKKVVVIFFGSDIRPVYLDGALLAMHSYNEDAIRAHVSVQKQRVRLFEKYADNIVSQVPISTFQVKPFIQYIKIGIPIPLRDLPQPTSNSRVRILHAPSDINVKGTCEIEKIIQRLKIKGYDIDFIKLEHRPNVEVLDEMSRCDFIVDQVYSDIPTSYLVLEGASMGKPTVLSGYHPYSDTISEYCHPDELESRIEYLINNREYRLQVGARARAFVREHWKPEDIARTYLVILEGGDVPDDFMFDPADLDYTLGCGVPQRLAEENTKKYSSDNRQVGRSVRLNLKGAVEINIYK